MSTSLGVARRAIDRGVRHVCEDADRTKPERVSGRCRIVQFLPELVEIVEEVRSNSLAAYDQAIRRRICSWCQYQTADGHCPLRIMGQCCLSSELHAVVDILKRLNEAETASTPAY